MRQYIGLMYPSDYGYAAGSSCLSTTLWNYGDGCQNSDYLYNSGEYEWLQAPNVSDSFYATLLVSTGRVNAKYSKGSPYEVHPVLYLSSDVKITSGDGSQNNPFQLS